jgi:ribosomal subunit interface protein
MKEEIMEIILRARNAVVAEDFKDITSEKLQSLQRFSVAIDRIELEVIHESNPKFGKKSHKVVLTSRGSGPLLRSESYGFNDLAAFDDAVKNLELQIRKVHERSKEILRGSIRKETNI